MINHYKYLELHLGTFLINLKVNCDTSEGGIRSLLSAHGDKAYGYKGKWEQVGIPFYQGVAIYLLSYLSPYEKYVRQTENGWVDPGDWVIEMYPEFSPWLPL